MKLHADMADQRGQALPFFALMLVVLLAATGLVIDVGGAWAQERGQQKASDTAALAGATAEANGASRQAIIDAATANGVANGYAPGEIQVNIPPTTGKYGPGGAGYSANDCSTPALYPCWIEVKITRGHTNAFAGIVGQTSWQVGARGVAVGGIANSVVSDIAPIMFNDKAVQLNDRSANKRYCDPQDNKCNPNNDFPLGADQFNWTTFCVAGGTCNVNTAQAVDIINDGGIQLMINLLMPLGAHNQGQHTAICHALQDYYPDGKDVPVSINDDNGRLLGFWMWHFDAANTDCGGTDGELLSGWFVDKDYIDYDYPLTIIAGGGNATFGMYVARLVE